MKKYLIVSLSILTVTPVIANVTSQSNTFIKSNSNKNLIQSISQNSKINNKTSSNQLDWKYIQTTIDTAIDDPTVMSSLLKTANINSQSEDLEPLKKAEKDFIKETTASYIDDFKAKEFTNSTQVTNYLSEDNTDFSEYYTDIAKGGKTIEEQVLFDFFSNKIDLDVFGDASYEDVIVILKDKINSVYKTDDLKITLADETMSKKVLFDDSNENNVINFVNDNIIIPVQVQVNNGEIYNQNIRLKNIKLDTSETTADKDNLLTAVKTYFNTRNPQDLNLDVSDTYETAFYKIYEKINNRFPGIWEILILMPGMSDLEKHFVDPDVLNDLANERIVREYLLYSSKDDWVFLNIPFEFSKTETMEYIPKLFYQREDSLQDLALTTDNTFQDVVNRLNERLERLFPEANVVSYLADNSNPETKLQEQYRPDIEDQKYKIDLSFKVISTSNGQEIVEQDYSVTTLFLNNVDLGAEAKEIKESYDDLTELIQQIRDAQLITENIAVVLAIAATGFWAASWLFGITTAWAIACTVAGSALGAASAGMTVAITNYKGQISNILQGAGLVFAINRLGVAIGLIIREIVIGINVVLTATSVLTMGLTLIGVAAFSTLITIVSYYLETH